MFFIKSCLAITILNVVKTEYYTNRNATLVFDFYKEKYHKKYTPNDEKLAYKNFIVNLNKVTQLNMNPKEKNIIYTLNKYADVNPSEIQEHFALNVSAYDTHEVYKGPIIRDRHKALRTNNEPTPEGEDLESLELYDLDDSKNLFNRYLTAFRKNITKRYDRVVHFYKFVKSLVDVNREHYNGNKTTEINEKSDIVEHPTDYYY